MAIIYETVNLYNKQHGVGNGGGRKKKEKISGN